MLFIFLAVLLFAGQSCAEDRLPPQGRFADVNGIRMYYETYGQGTPLIALHGFGGSSAMWSRFVADFSKEYRLIVPDLRGHGRSTNPTGQFTHRQSALDVYALLDQLGIRQFRAMGVSTGGMTLLHMATQQSSRVEALVWIGATTYFPEQAREVMRRSTVESLTPADWERMRGIHKNGDDQIRALRTEFYNFKDSYEDMNFTPPLLGTISARTLIIHGDRDEFFPVAIPTDAYRAIPHAYLWIVPNGGHVPINEHAAEFTKTTLEFLRGDWEKK